MSGTVVVNGLPRMELEPLSSARSGDATIVRFAVLTRPGQAAG